MTQAPKLRVKPRLIQRRREVVRQLVAEDLTDGQIAARLGVAPRTVLRDRQAMNLAPAVPKNRKGVPTSGHGSVSRYKYCHCDICRKAESARQRKWGHDRGLWQTYYVDDCPCGAPRHRVDDPYDFTCPTTNERHTRESPI
jgi:hypothetical protein